MNLRIRIKARIFGKEVYWESGCHLFPRIRKGLKNLLRGMGGSEKGRITYNFRRTFFPHKIFPRNLRQPTSFRADKFCRAEKMLDEHRNPFDGVRSGLA